MIYVVSFERFYLIKLFRKCSIFIKYQTFKGLLLLTFNPIKNQENKKEKVNLKYKRIHMKKV